VEVLLTGFTDFGLGLLAVFLRCPSAEPDRGSNMKKDAEISIKISLFILTSFGDDSTVFSIILFFLQIKNPNV
jgi:hypothetical protein